MECTNNHCLWSSFGSCCHEDPIEADEYATPNQLDCPVSLRADFTVQLFKLIDECSDLLNSRNMSELIAIKKFILSQRKDEKQ